MADDVTPQYIADQFARVHAHLDEIDRRFAVNRTLLAAIEEKLNTTLALARAANADPRD